MTGDGNPPRSGKVKPPKMPSRPIGVTEIDRTRSRVCRLLDLLSAIEDRGRGLFSDRYQMSKEELGEFRSILIYTVKDLTHTPVKDESSMLPDEM